jgi:hypothetical protein
LATTGNPSGGTGIEVHALAWTEAGALRAGGYFTSIDGVAAPYIATLATTCAAAAVPAGVGCTGSAGPNTLVATTLPWVGGTFAALAAGMPAVSIAVSVFGLQPVAIPLAALLPQGQPGCSLFASPDLLLAGLPTGGAWATHLAIPNAPALAGMVLHCQVAALEFDPLGAFVALTSTNALQLTIGSY